MQSKKILTFFEVPADDPGTPCQFAIYGIPWDSQSTHRKGAPRSAPTEIRLRTFELATGTELGVDIYSMNIIDFGDVEIKPSFLKKNIDNIVNFVKSLVEIDNSPESVLKSSESGGNIPIPVMIGGDHYCTYPVVKALSDFYNKKGQNIGIIVFDAHLDYYDKWLDEEPDMHCTVTKRIADIPSITPQNIAVIGARDIDMPEYRQAEMDGLFYIPGWNFGIKDPSTASAEMVKKVIDYFRKRNIDKVYISIDIDVLDAAIVPGTGYSIPGGLTYRQLWTMLYMLVREFSVIGFDLVEVAPDLDTDTYITQNAAVKIIMELMGFIHMKKEGILPDLNV